MLSCTKRRCSMETCAHLDLTMTKSNHEVTTDHGHLMDSSSVKVCHRLDPSRTVYDEVSSLASSMNIYLIILNWLYLICELMSVLPFSCFTNECSKLMFWKILLAHILTFVSKHQRVLLLV